jgi:hypothetical protein
VSDDSTTQCLLFPGISSGRQSTPRTRIKMFRIKMFTFEQLCSPSDLKISGSFAAELSVRFKPLIVMKNRLGRTSTAAALQDPGRGAKVHARSPHQSK